MKIELDAIDLKIIRLLKQDSQLTHKQIGEHVHRTGQAVGFRIAQLVEYNIIENYTIKIKYEHQQFIRLFLNEQQSFIEVEEIVKRYSQVIELFKVIGGACYVVISSFTPSELNVFIEELSQWCRYSIETVIKEVKL